MKRAITFLIIFLSCISFAQVGVGTVSPQASLQIVGTPNDFSKPDGIILPKLSRASIVGKSSVYGPSQAGAIVYITDISGASNTPTANINKIGYYYFNGAVWNSLETTAGTVSFTASLGNGDGRSTAVTIGASAFNTVRLNEVSNTGGGTWDTSNYTYTVPITGTYFIKSSIRLVDAFTNNSPSRDIFQAVGTTNTAISDGVWEANSGDRWTMLYNRIAKFNKGDLLRLYIYSDGAVANLSDASLNISLMNVN